MRILPVPLFAAFVCSGCVGFSSSLLENDQGIVYNLPRSLLTITVTQYNDRAAGRTWYQIAGTKKQETNGNVTTLTDEIKSESIPDPGHRYVAQYHPSAFHDDRLCVSRTPTGLLYDINFASDDRTPEVVVNIARLIASAVGERPTGYTDSQETGDEKPVVRSYTGKLDPLNNSDVTTFNNALRNTFGEDVELDVGRMREIFRSHTAPLPAGCEFGRECQPTDWTDRCTDDAICYRTQLEVPIDLRHNGHRVDVNYAKVINPWDVGAISVTRSFLVHKISKFTFDKGILIGAVVRKPSEMEELSLIPLNIVYAALATPAGAVATAFSSSDADKVKLLQEMANINTEVAKLQNNMAHIESGLGPTIAANATTEEYKLECQAPGRTGSFVSIVAAGGNN